MIGFAWTLLLSALPPEDPRSGRPLQLGDPLPQKVEAGAGPALTLGLWGRLTAIEGTVVEGFPFGEDMTYGDLFGNGVGFRAEGGLLWRMNPDWQLGPLLSIGVDRFAGSKETDEVGDSLEPEDLRALSLLLGFRGVFQDRSGFWADARVLMGAVRWSDVDATFTISGTPIEGVAFLEGATRFAFELGARGGFRTGSVAFGLGVGFNLQGGPERGSDVTDVVDPSSVVGVYVDLGVEIGF